MSIELGRNYFRAGLGRVTIVIECDPRLEDWVAVRSDSFDDDVTFREVTVWPFGFILEIHSPRVNATKSEAV